MAKLAWGSGMLAIVVASGCADTPTSLVYDSCNTLNDCVESAEVCEEISTDIAGLTFTNAICTVGCTTTGDNRPECPQPLASGLGRGSCYVGTDVGGTSTTPVCFEPCIENGDCLRDFVCRSDVEICGTSSSCPIQEGDSICVPGPL